MDWLGVHEFREIQEKSDPGGLDAESKKGEGEPMHSLRWIVLLVTCAAVNASEEGYLAWASATITVKCKKEDTPAGPISFEIAQSDGVYSKLVIHAFAQEFKLSDEDLAKLKDFPIKSLQTTHEAGYESLGGYSVHCRFERTIYSEKKKPVTEVIYVTATKLGVKVSDVRKK